MNRRTFARNVAGSVAAAYGLTSQPLLHGEESPAAAKSARIGSILRAFHHALDGLSRPTF